MIDVTVYANNETLRLTVEPVQLVHAAIAEAFGCSDGQVERVLFGEADVLDDQSFEDHGIEVALRTPPALCLRSTAVLHSQRRPGSLSFCVSVARTGRGSA